MGGKDTIEMSLRELSRLKAVQSAIDGHITQRTAAASMVGLTERQVRRLVRAVRAEGAIGHYPQGAGAAIEQEAATEGQGQDHRSLQAEVS